MSRRPLIDLSEDEARSVLQLWASGGVLLPDALYTLAEVARLIGCSTRQARRKLEEPGPLRRGLHHSGQGRHKLLVRGSAIMQYQGSLRG